MNKNLTDFLPGLRIIKTALATVTCILLLHLFTDDSSLYFYGAIAVIITMQSTVSHSLRIGLTRIGGSIIGSIIAFIATYLALFLNIQADNVILVFCAIVITVQLCVLLNIKESILVACILYLASITIIPNNEFTHYIFFRLLATSFGVIISLIFNSIIFKPKTDHLDK